MSDDAITKVVSFVGHSNSGKTTLLERVVKELKHRGYRVGIIKHTNKACEIDLPGKDSWRYARAGSDVVVLSSQNKLAVIENLVREPGLAEILDLLEGKADIILAEGYKDLTTPKILVRGKNEQMTPDFNGELLATVFPSVLPNGVRLFTTEDVTRVVELLVERLVTNHAPGEMVETP